MTTTVGLLMCGHVHPDALEIGGDYPDLFGSLLGPLGIEVVPYAAEDGVLPDSVDECDGWITSPSRSSVLDDLPWIHRLGDFVGEIVVRERPFVGVCFGHQMLATLFGGRVQRADGGWGVGVKDYEIVEQRPWMIPPRDRISLVASHEDQVTELPHGAVLLARSDYCPIAAFELGPRCISLQPHIEFSPQISARLMDLRQDIIGAEVVAAARQTLGRTPDRALVAGWFAEFLAG